MTSVFYYSLTQRSTPRGTPCHSRGYRGSRLMTLLRLSLFQNLRIAAIPALSAVVSQRSDSASQLWLRSRYPLVVPTLTADVFEAALVRRSVRTPSIVGRSVEHGSSWCVCVTRAWVRLSLSRVLVFAPLRNCIARFKTSEWPGRGFSLAVHSPTTFCPGIRYCAPEYP